MVGVKYYTILESEMNVQHSAEGIGKMASPENIIERLDLQ